MLIFQSVNLLGFGKGYSNSNREYVSGMRVAAHHHAMPPKFMAEICSPEDEPVCDPDYKFRTISGECNNLG